MFYNFLLKIGTTQCLFGVNHHLEEGGTEFLSKSVEGSWILRFSLLCGSLIFCPFLCFCRIISFKVYIFLMHRYLCICTHIYKGGPGLFIRFPESVCTGVYSSDFLFLVSCKCTVPQVVTNGKHKVMKSMKIEVMNSFSL